MCWAVESGPDDPGLLRPGKHPEMASAAVPERRRGTLFHKRENPQFRKDMKKAVLAFALVAVLGTPSFAQSVGEKTAEMMLADHTKTSTELKSMVRANLKAALPTALDDASQKKIAKLRDAKPENFASEYDPMQVSAHKDAVSLFERNGGEDPKLKDCG
jgi:Domain of unknown function (DUF4142)